MIERRYAEYAVQMTEQLLAIDSPTGFTSAAAAWCLKAFRDLGFAAEYTNKGGVMVDLGGDDASPEGGLLLEAHIDTLGGMVAAIKPDGRLKITNLGGLRADNVETENVRVYTRAGQVYEGTAQLMNASVHNNPNYSTTPRSWDTVEIVLDEDVKSAADTKALGIRVGDIVCPEPRTRTTASGYIKSRYLDDKLCVGILLGFAAFLRNNQIRLSRHVYAHITVYEEVGHGGAGPVPAGVTEGIALDMGCVGDGLNCTERQVSICTKDGKGPYCYEVISGLIEAAEAEGADYETGCYINYSSDIEVTAASHDIRHGLIGPGVYASHGYERSHIDGVWSTLKVLKGYLKV